MNKKTYVRPTVLERNVRVSMMCLSQREPIYGAKFETFEREPKFGPDYLHEIDAQNDDVWGPNDHID